MQSIRVIIMKGEVAPFVAQGLEFDIAAQGDSIQDVMDSWTKTVVAQVIDDLESGREALENVPSAPERFFDMWRSSQAAPVIEPPRMSDFIRQNCPPAWVISKFRPEPRIQYPI